MKIAVVDYRIHPEEEANLKAVGYKSIKCSPCKELYPAVDGHPDMQLHLIKDLHNKIAVVQRNLSHELRQQLIASNYNILNSSKNLNTKYPEDIMLNGLSIGPYFIHNTNYTDEVLKAHLSHREFILVRQGYTGCSCSVISPTALMTSDIGIAKALQHKAIDVLLLPPGDILLPGLNYGFIGGCCGLLEENLLAFYGDLNYYKNGDLVMKFLKTHKVEPIFLRKGPLIDRGGILLL